VTEPATRVRLSSDPGRQGITTGKIRIRGNRKFLQVAFPDAYQYIAEAQLEIIDDAFEDAFDFFSKGKFGRARHLRSAITHIRLSGRLADLIYSMETTNTDFYAYQFKPVLKFLESPSGGILIADEVGLGKTIEAGLIWTELRSRYDARRLMVVCPAMLREKWMLELKRRFDISGRMVDAKETLKTLKMIKSGDLQEFAIIGSMQGLRPDRSWKEDDTIANKASVKLAKFLDESVHDQPLIDLLIVDEAHYLRNASSMTSRLGRMLRQLADNVLLLSATPIHLSNENLYQLLNIVDEDAFNQIHVFDDILHANAPLIKARDIILHEKADVSKFIEQLEAAKTNPLLRDNRQIQAILENPPDEETIRSHAYRSKIAHRLETINLLGHAVTRTRKREVTEWKVIRGAVPEMVEMTDAEADFYQKVTSLVRHYCLLNDAHDGFLLVTPQRQISSSMPAALREWQNRKLQIDTYEDLGEDPENTNAKTVGPLVRTILDSVEELGDLKELWRHDSKYNRLSTELKRYLKDNPKDKIVIFAYFRPTLYYLYERFNEEGIKSLLVVGGGKADKYDIIENFQNPKGPNILLASEVASEGIDLQFSRVIINYDLPWNPMKVEQRIGRIDRIGQKSPKISIWNLFYANTIDARIHERLYKRLGIFEYALGGFEAVIGEEIKKMTIDLLKDTLTPEQEEARIIQTQQAISNLRDEEERLEKNANNLIAHGDYILHQVQAAREMGRWITGEDLWNYTQDFFNQYYQGCEFRQLRPEEPDFEIKLSDTACFDLDKFIKRQGLETQTRLSRSAFSPVKCRFKNKVSDFRQKKIEYINQFHPLIKFISKSIQETINQNKYVHFPAVSIRMNHKLMASQKAGDFIFYVERWTVKGMKDIEKLVYFAKDIQSFDFLEPEKAEQLVTTAAKAGKDWLSAANEMDTSQLAVIADECKEAAERQYSEYIESVINENSDRADLQEKTLKLHLERQREIFLRVIQTHEEKGNIQMIPPTRKKIENMENKVNTRLLEIKEKRNPKHHSREVCLGIVRLD